MTLGEFIVVVPYGTNWIDPDIKFRGNSHLESDFAGFWVQFYPETDLYYEWKPIQGRRLTIDFAHPKSKVGIEIQGGTHNPKMAHSSGTGILRDAKKSLELAQYGWRIIPVTAEQIRDYHETLPQIKTVIDQRMVELYGTAARS